MTTHTAITTYLRGQIQRGLCEGSIRPTKCALEFIFQNTLRRQWDLFKKRSPLRAASVCPWCPAMPSADVSSPLSIIRSIAQPWL